jgi:hypothetical protein
MRSVAIALIEVTVTHSAVVLSYCALFDNRCAAYPCGACASCTAVCAKGFDIADRVKDISRLRAVPGDFFA